MSEQEQILALKAALLEAILSTHRVSERCVDIDPAGGEYEIDWLPEVVRWAKLCDLDLESKDPGFYWRR